MEDRGKTVAKRLGKNLVQIFEKAKTVAKTKKAKICTSKLNLKEQNICIKVNHLYNLEKLTTKLLLKLHFKSRV
jgi:hypothetical protein